MTAFHCLPKVMRIKSRIRTGKAIAACFHIDVEIVGDNILSAVLVVFGPALDVANTATSRGSLRQVYRVSETNESSAALTVNQTASLCEEMRKSLRTCGLLGFSRCLTVSLSRSRWRGPSPPYRANNQMVGLGILGGRTVRDSVGSQNPMGSYGTATELLGNSSGTGTSTQGSARMIRVVGMSEMFARTIELSVGRVGTS